MSASASTVPAQSAGSSESAAQKQQLLGAVVADLFMPQYLPRGSLIASAEGYTSVVPQSEAAQRARSTPVSPTAETDGDSAEKKKKAFPAGVTSSTADTQFELLNRIADHQSTAIASVKAANNRLRAFGLESDKMLPTSSTALFQHVQLVAAVRKELELLEMRVGRCLERAERIKAFDEARATTEEADKASNATTVGSGGANSSNGSPAVMTPTTPEEKQ